MGGPHLAAQGLWLPGRLAGLRNMRADGFLLLSARRRKTLVIHNKKAARGGPSIHTKDSNSYALSMASRAASFASPTF